MHQVNCHRNSKRLRMWGNGMHRIVSAAIGLCLGLAAQATAERPSEAKAEDRFEILQSLDRYQEVATRCYFAGQEYEVGFVFDALLDTDKISDVMESAMSRLAAQIDPQPAIRAEPVGGGGQIDPNFTSCFLQGSKPRRGKSPVRAMQSSNLPTVVVAVLATNMDVDKETDIAERAEISSAVFDGWPDVVLDENGGWHGRSGFQDYISMISSVGPAGLLQCQQNKQPTFEMVPSKFLVEIAIMRCKATAESRAATLIMFGLGNFVGWGQFDQTEKLDIEDAGYFALRFEVFRGLGKIVGE